MGVCVCVSQVLLKEVMNGFQAVRQKFPRGCQYVQSKDAKPRCSHGFLAKIPFHCKSYFFKLCLNNSKTQNKSADMIFK